MISGKDVSNVAFRLCSGCFQRCGGGGGGEFVSSRLSSVHVPDVWVGGG